MFGWRIRGRWTGGGATGEREFTVLTRTPQPEDAKCRALKYLIGVALMERPNAQEVSVELLDEPQQIAEVVPAERAA